MSDKLRRAANRTTGENDLMTETSWSENYTIKSKALQAARKAGVEPSMVETVERDFMKFYRFPMPPSAAAERLARRAKQGSKIAECAEMLRRPGGATKEEIAEATGWQPHSMRGAISSKISKILADGEVIAHWRGRSSAGYAIIDRGQQL